jgi:hypothetical protein
MLFLFGLVFLNNHRLVSLGFFALNEHAHLLDLFFFFFLGSSGGCSFFLFGHLLH